MSDWLSLNNTVTVTETSRNILNCVNLTVELKVKMHKVEVRQHVCSANAKFALLFASFTKRFNGARLPYTELGYPHDTSMLYSEWVIIITNTVNIFTFLIQAPYNIDIYKRSMKMKPVRQIMYSVDVTVCFSLCERIPMDILVGRGGGRVIRHHSWLWLCFERNQQKKQSVEVRKDTSTTMTYYIILDIASYFVWYSLILEENKMSRNHPYFVRNKVTG